MYKARTIYKNQKDIFHFKRFKTVVIKEMKILPH